MTYEKLRDWSLIYLSIVILIGVAYGIWADVLDGKLINPVLEFGTRSKEVTHQTTKCEYRPGEEVWARILFHKNRNLVGKLHWRLVNHYLRDYPERQGGLPVGVWDKIVKVETLPLDVRPGEHWFAGTVSYHPNWIGTVEYPIWTNKFMVVAP